MANIQSAKKRMRQNVKRREHNRRYKSGARTYVKKVRSLIADGKIAEAEEALKMASSVLDKAARKGVLHKGNASRRKGRLMAFVANAKKQQAA